MRKSRNRKYNRRNYAVPKKLKGTFRKNDS